MEKSENGEKFREINSSDYAPGACICSTRGSVRCSAKENQSSVYNEEAAFSLGVFTCMCVCVCLCLYSNDPVEVVGKERRHDRTRRASRRERRYRGFGNCRVHNEVSLPWRGDEVWPQWAELSSSR